jgi:LacI family transcriptional regulator
MVFLDTGRVGLRTSNIEIKYESGINEAVAHLVHLGHKRIGFISGPLKHASALARQAAFIKCLQEYDLLQNEALLQVGNFKIDGGEAAIKRLLHLEKRPTAVMASNDLSAIGAMRAILQSGLRIPDDISIIGFDDIDFCQITQPPLTTIQISRRYLAEKAFDALASIMKGKSKRGRHYAVETRLIIRGSTGVCHESPKVF